MYYSILWKLLPKIIDMMCIFLQTLMSVMKGALTIATPMLLAAILLEVFNAHAWMDLVGME